MARRSQRLRLIAALLASLAAGGPLLAAAHVALVQHVTCSHGEAVEVATDRGHAHSAWESDAHHHAGACIGASESTHEHEHDHCTVCHPHKGRTSSIGTRFAALPLHGRPLTATIGRPATPQIALLRLAPKSSPPA